MRGRIVSHIPVLLLSLVAVAGLHRVSAQTEPVEKEILVIVDNRQAWPDCRLSSLVTNRLIEHNFLRVVDPGIGEEILHHPAGVMPRQQLMEVGQRRGCRFILWCAIDQEQMIREDNFSIPLVAKQRRVKAVMTGRYYILDCERGRIVRKGTIDLNTHGPSSLQVVDFGDADPELLVPYREQAKLFGELEMQAAKQIEGDVLEIAKLR